jgi:hypothetical protein
MEAGINICKTNNCSSSEYSRQKEEGKKQCMNAFCLLEKHTLVPNAGSM